MSEPYDIAIIGGGPGGYVAAIQAAQRGARVALVEKQRLGGTCLNRGCIPSKAMVRDAELYRDALSGEFGLDTDGAFRINFGRMMARKRAVVDTLVQGVEHLMNAHRIDVLAGHGCIEGPGVVTVQGSDGATRVEARAIILASGSVPTRVGIPGEDLPGVVTSDGMFELEQQPKSMVVVGASTVGVEFACIFQAIGTQVNVLGRSSFLRDAEQQLAKRLRTMLTQRGIGIQIGLEFKEIVHTDEGLLRVLYERRGQVESVEGEIVLLSTGRSAFTEGLGLEQAGVAMRGQAIVVDEYLQTNVPGIYAIGDCIGGYMLAHVASYEGEVAVDNILGNRRPADYRVVPNCIFTIPELADVGLTEAQAKEAGLAVKVSRFPLGVNGRALALGEPEGQLRMICEAGDDEHGGRVLGVHILGARASDLIAEASLAMKMGATAKDIAQTIHAHPTVPEALMEVAMGQLHGAIHFEQR
ncbi:MAG: dihydrolipoyl dehydrogenase [Anaerolineae bacterium]